MSTCFWSGSCVYSLHQLLLITTAFYSSGGSDFELHTGTTVERRGPDRRSGRRREGFGHAADPCQVGNTQASKCSPSVGDTKAPRSRASGKLNLSLAFTLVPVCGNTHQLVFEGQLQVVLAGDGTPDIAASTWVSIAGLKSASFLQRMMTPSDCKLHGGSRACCANTTADRCAAGPLESACALSSCWSRNKI